MGLLSLRVRRLIAALLSIGTAAAVIGLAGPTVAGASTRHGGKRHGSAALSPAARRYAARALRIAERQDPAGVRRLRAAERVVRAGRGAAVRPSSGAMHAAIMVAGGGTVTNPFAFGSAVNLVSNGPGYPAAVAAGDLNGDGLPDVVSTWDSSSPSVVVTPNPSSSSDFGSSYPLSGGNPVQVALADVNGDGLKDIVVLAGDGTVSVLLNNASDPGTFEPATTYSAGSNAAGLAVGALTTGGLPDIAVTTQASNSVAVLKNNGDGTFGDPTDYPVGNTPESVVIGDFNGNPSLAVANYHSNTISVLYGDGNGNLSPQVQVPAGDSPFALAVGDFNGDGSPDLAVVGWTANTDDATAYTSVLLNNGQTGADAAFDAITQVAALPDQTASTLPRLAVAQADINGSGNPDLVVQNGYFTYIYPGNGDGTFGSPASVGTGDSPGQAVADINGDGAPDLIQSAQSSSTVTYSPHIILPSNQSPPSMPKMLVGQSSFIDPGAWDHGNDSGFLTYQWQVQRCDAAGDSGSCSDINSPDASGSGSYPTYSPTTGDVGSTLRAEIWASNQAGQSAPVYTNTGNVIPPPPQETAPIQLTGVPTVGNRVSVGGDTWNMSVSRYYDWFLCPSGVTDPFSSSACEPFAYGNRTVTIPSSAVGSDLLVVDLVSNSSHGDASAVTTPELIEAIKPQQKLPSAVQGTSYSETLTTQGGTGPYSYSLANGSSLPGTLSLSPSGTISGDPGPAGVYTFTVQSTDSASDLASRTLTLMVGPGISPATLAKATAGQDYSEQLTATGGSGPYTWSPISGSLPSGVTLSPQGLLSGQPSSSGTYRFTVQVTDSSSPALSSKKSYVLKVS